MSDEPKRQRPGFVDTVRRGWKPLAKRQASNGGGPAPSEEPVAGPAELQRQRDELARRFAELQWDLGGIAYEMASRDHYRLDVLNRKAAEIQDVDAELSQIERLMKLNETGAAGACSACGALHARSAHFCWQCGKQLTTPASPSGRPR